MGGDFGSLREILYFITDLRGREHLTHNDVSGFFFSFSATSFVLRRLFGDIAVWHS